MAREEEEVRYCFVFKIAGNAGSDTSLVVGSVRCVEGTGTGQDRTDRTGQDRTGQDRTGQDRTGPDSYTHLRAHETKANLVCRLLLEKKKNKTE